MSSLGKRTVPTRMAVYTMIKMLGKGSFGNVYSARHKETGDMVAVKVVDKSMLVNHRLNREIEMGRKLSEIDGFVKFLDHVDTKKKAYLIYEYLDGGDLFSLIRPDYGVEEDVARACFIQVVSTLAEAHERGIKHGDVKPENIVVDTLSGQFKLVDYGYCDFVDLPVAPDSGTVPYNAPEMFFDGEDRVMDGAACDVFSTGVLLYAMLTGRLPWDGAAVYSPDYIDFSHGGCDPAVWGLFTPRLIELFRRMLAYNPADRCDISYCLEFVNDLWLSFDGVTPCASLCVSPTGSGGAFFAEEDPALAATMGMGDNGSIDGTLLGDECVFLMGGAELGHYRSVVDSQALARKAAEDFPGGQLARDGSSSDSGLAESLCERSSGSKSLHEIIDNESEEEAERDWSDEGLGKSLGVSAPEGIAIEVSRAKKDGEEISGIPVPRLSSSVLDRVGRFARRAVADEEAATSDYFSGAEEMTSSMTSSFALVHSGGGGARAWADEDMYDSDTNTVFHSLTEPQLLNELTMRQRRLSNEGETEESEREEGAERKKKVTKSGGDGGRNGIAADNAAAPSAAEPLHRRVLGQLGQLSELGRRWSWWGASSTDDVSAAASAAAVSAGNKGGGVSGDKEQKKGSRGGDVDEAFTVEDTSAGTRVSMRKAKKKQRERKVSRPPKAALGGNTRRGGPVAVPHKGSHSGGKGVMVVRHHSSDGSGVDGETDVSLSPVVTWHSQRVNGASTEAPIVAAVATASQAAPVKGFFVSSGAPSLKVRGGLDPVRRGSFGGSMEFSVPDEGTPSFMLENGAESATDPVTLNPYKPKKRRAATVRHGARGIDRAATAAAAAAASTPRSALTASLLEMDPGVSVAPKIVTSTDLGVGAAAGPSEVMRGKGMGNVASEDVLAHDNEPSVMYNSMLKLSITLRDRPLSLPS